MATRIAKTKAEELLEIKEDYIAAGKPWPASAKQIAAWAIEKGLWRAARPTLLKQCAKELAEALGEQYYTDRQGRRVRMNHVARFKREGQQMALWADIRTARREHMEVAFTQRSNS